LPTAHCPFRPGTWSAWSGRASHGIREAVSYQPLSHYWPLQFAETGLMLAFALALAWYCYLRLNRRLS
jgi:hypothetical protein